MGLVIAVFGLIISFILIFIPKIFAKNPQGGLWLFKKEQDKYKFKPHLGQSVEATLGKNKAYVVSRILGIICLIFSIIAYFDSSSP